MYTHAKEIEELEDAIIRDDDNGVNGCGEVVWIDEDHPEYAITRLEIWLHSLTKGGRCHE